MGSKYIVKFTDTGKYLDCVGMEVDRRLAFEFDTRDEAEDEAYKFDGVAKVIRING